MNCDRSIKVLLFSPDTSWGGGVVEFNELLTRKLDSRFDVQRFAIGRRPGLFGRFFRMLMPIFDALRLARCLVRCRHDVYHLNPSMVPRALARDGLFMMVLRMFRRQNVLVFFRGWDPQYFARIASSAIRRNLFVSLYSRAKRLLVLSSSFARDLSSIGVDPAKVQVLTTMFDGSILRTVVRRRPDRAVWILFLARFEASKGIFELLDAFKRVRDANEDISLILAGDGVEATSARAWCNHNGMQDQVRFTGYISGTAKAQLLIDSDIFVLPTFHNEGCPNALLEAMGAGLPVVATPVGGIPEVVADGVNGILVQPRDPAALAGALQRLIHDPALRAEMGQRNRKKAWDNYEAESVTSALASHYCEIGR